MEKQRDILAHIENSGLNVFTVEDIKNCCNYSDKQVYNALYVLERNKSIFQLGKGKYCRYNFSDEYVIGSFLVKTGGIAYYSALHYHGLTEQIPNVVYVETGMQKKDKIIFGVKYKFIKVKSEKLTGFKTLGYGNMRFKITDVEKTIVDCFDLPQYGGGYTEIIKGFSKAKLSARKMVKYCKAVNNIAVTKRLAYLCELLEKPKMEYFIKYALSVRNDKYNVFETGGEPTGKAVKRWRLLLNMEEDEIIEIANS